MKTCDNCMKGFYGKDYIILIDGRSLVVCPKCQYFLHQEDFIEEQKLCPECGADLNDLKEHTHTYP